MMRRCADTDFKAIESIINEAAVAYRGHIPSDCYHVPYMTGAALRAELDAGVSFWGWENEGELVAVMGIERKRSVTLIRHAYTRTSWQGRGLGSQLLDLLIGQAQGPLLIGTWAGATWAIEFYQRRGFEMLPPATAAPLLDKYWRVPPRQKEPEVSVVLAHRERPLPEDTP